MSGSRKLAQILIGVSLCAIMLSGCSRFRLPAIDPTGSRIFLPAPAATSIASPLDVPCRLPSLISPAYTTPPTPPPCPESVAPAPAVPPRARGPHHWHQPLHGPTYGQVLVMPSRLVAPVNSDVVLLSGLCGLDGFYVKRETIEWMLTPDSVGHFVEVGDIGHKVWRAVQHQELGKQGIDYAVARTSPHPHLLTRGTPSPLDDVLVRKGQSWITISSPTEGTSYVTSLAPNAQPWDQRHRTATIYWIDAQWSFPAPAVVPAGKSHPLTTTVTRQTTGAAVEGYVVRYEVQTGVPASFAASGQPVIEVPTGAGGQATAELVPQIAQSGTTQIHVQIIRPQLDGQQRVVVGEGWTTVTWSAPGLAVVVTGPEVASVGAVAVYQIQVSNPGDLPARSVTVTQQLPPGLAFLGSNPPAQQFGDRLQWHMGDLAPQSAQTIQVECRAERAGDVPYCARAESADGLVAEGCVQTRIFQPSLNVDINGPATAEVGYLVTFQIVVTNTGSQALTNIVLVDRFDPGLRHSEGQTSPIEFGLGDLLAGDSATKELSFIVERPGELCHTVEAIAPGGTTATASSCVTVTQPAAPPAQPAPPAAQGQLQVRKYLIGPEQTPVESLQTTVDSFVDFVVEVTNTGNVPLTNLRVVDTPDPALVPRRAPQGYDEQALERGELIWIFGELGPGQTLRLQIYCLAAAPNAAATNRVAVTATENVSGSAQAVVRIVPAAQPQDQTPVPEPVSGELLLSLAETTDPLPVGQTTTYIATIDNQRSASARSVQLTVRIPEGLEFGSITQSGRTNGPAVPSYSQDRRTAQITIREMRAGEKISFRIEARALRSGMFQIQAQLDSLALTAPVTATEDTTVFGE